MTKIFEILPGDSIVYAPTPAKWFFSEFVFLKPEEPLPWYFNWKTLGKGSKEEMVLLGESLGLEPKVIEGSLTCFWKDPSGKFFLETKDRK